MNPGQKEQILETMRLWLEEVSQVEALPDGFPESEIASATQPDLFTLAKTMTTLSENFRVQGKVFRKLQDEIQRLINLSKPEPVLLPVQPSMTVSEIMEAGREEGRNEVLSEMIEIHDRLCRTLDDCDRKVRETGFFSSWLGGNEVQKAMVEGLRISKSRYDEFLAKHAIRQFAQVGEDFDPGSMKAVDAVQTPLSPAGRIIGIVHYGYRGHEKIIRQAEVIVSKSN